MDFQQLFVRPTQGLASPELSTQSSKANRITHTDARREIFDKNMKTELKLSSIVHKATELQTFMFKWCLEQRSCLLIGCFMIINHK